MSQKHVHAITVPEPILLQSATSDGTVEIIFNFYELIDLALTDKRFNEGRTAFHQADDLEEMFGEDVEPGTEVEVPEKLWQKLRDVLDKPQFGVRGDLGYDHRVRQAGAWIDMVCDAPKASKKKVVEKEAVKKEAAKKPTKPPAKRARKKK